MKYHDSKLYPLLIEQTKKRFSDRKFFVEVKNDYIEIYYKAMVFVIEPYDSCSEETFSIFAGLNKITLDDWDSEAYNYEYQMDGEFFMKTETDVFKFVDDLYDMIINCDAQKRCEKILKILQKLKNNLDEDSQSDMDFFWEGLHYFITE